MEDMWNCEQVKSLNFIVEYNVTGTQYLFYKCYIKVHIIFPCGIKPTNTIFKYKPEEDKRQTKAVWFVTLELLCHGLAYQVRELCKCDWQDVDR